MDLSRALVGKKGNRCLRPRCRDCGERAASLVPRFIGIVRILVIAKAVLPTNPSFRSSNPSDKSDLALEGRTSIYDNCFRSRCLLGLGFGSTVVSIEDFAVPDTKVIYAAVGSEEQFIEERDQPAKQQHLISHDEHIESVQIRYYNALVIGKEVGFTAYKEVGRRHAMFSLIALYKPSKELIAWNRLT
ncbi:xanthine/uracil/vitamin C permease [Striga asiatica]|uniref:Xanthine/uracil/vitamin C permease n=1 Tax=Striga asiatica TaxID=4170 RepID=A0A5A7Q3Q2_STRAF|nr:xanthine/uracil/vitamin C permease [Striga asiatica]